MSLTRRKLQTKFTSSKEEIDRCFERFNMLFPTDADKAEAIYSTLAPEGFHCDCGNLVSNRKYGERTARCSRCKKKASVTAKTFYEGIRKASAYCCATFLMGAGIVISGNEFAKRNGISSSQGSIILHSLSAAIALEMSAEAELLTALVLEPVGKRSSETPAREHPKAEQIEAEKRAAKNVSTTTRVNPRASDRKIPKGDLERRIFSLLKTDSLHPDDICGLAMLTITEVACALTLLELDGFVRCLPGNRYEVIERPANESVRALNKKDSRRVNNFIMFIKKSFHAISRKYLQRYFARYWCFIDREKWTFDSLLELFARSPYQTYFQLKSYVSPLAVRVVLSV
ncbi:MAG: hypothetical protein K2Y39_23610 [Candidatus Obscuribacterales bacterium]|nr:hypothetical protein [Candidatus Obscuribacterales bacterium]